MGIDNIEELFNLPPRKKAKKQELPEGVREQDLAPDADEKGDDAPAWAKDAVQNEPDRPDEVDQREHTR